MKKILIAGGSGFVGKALIRHLINCGYTVNVLTRRSSNISTENFQYFRWGIEKSYIDEKVFEGVIKIINLTGANIGEKRWTNKRKVEIIESRTKAAAAFNFKRMMNKWKKSFFLLLKNIGNILSLLSLINKPKIKLAF